MSNIHTQGQWNFGKFNNFEYYDIDCNGNRITSVYCGIDTQQDFQNEAEANAKLIAAAPELLELLQYIVNEIEITPDTLSDALLGLIKIKAVKAINKSTL